MNQQQFPSITIGKAVSDADLTVPIVAHVPRSGLPSSGWIDEITYGDVGIERYALLTTIVHLAQQLDEAGRKAIICTLLDEFDGRKATQLLEMLRDRFEMHFEA